MLGRLRRALSPRETQWEREKEEQRDTRGAHGEGGRDKVEERQWRGGLAGVGDGKAVERERGHACTSCSNEIS